jgi:hypothetical protein
VGAPARQEAISARHARALSGLSHPRGQQIDAETDAVACHKKSPGLAKKSTKRVITGTASRHEAIAVCSADQNNTRKSLEMRLSGIVRLFEPLIRRQAAKQGGEAHRRFKEILENLTAGAVCRQVSDVVWEPNWEPTDTYLAARS